MIYVDETLISLDDRQAEADLATVQSFLDAHGTALANAAYLLGGRAMSGLVFDLIDGIRGRRQISKAQVKGLERLHALLVLEDVGDPERLETALFADVITSSRAVDEICLLADSLDDLLRHLGNHEEALLNEGGDVFSKAA